MRTRSITRFTLAILSIAFFASCKKKSNTDGLYIPKDASFAMVTDSKSILSKVSPEDIMASPIFQEMLKDTTLSANTKAMLAHPDSTGFDFTGDIEIFSTKDSIGSYFAVEGDLKDSGLYSSYIQRMMPGGTLTKKDDVEYLSGKMGKRNACIGWRKDKLICVFDIPAVNPMVYGGFQLKDSSTQGRDVVATCQAIYALPQDSSMAQEEKFTSLLKETGDLHVWMNTEKMYGSMLAALPLSIANVDDLIKERISTFTVNFDNGKISITGKSYMNDKALGLYKDVIGDKVNDDMIKCMPGKEADGILAVNFKPAGITEILKFLNLDGIANTGLSRFNITLDDITSAFKGDVFFGATDFNLTMDSVGEAPFRYASPVPEGNFVFAASIGDKKEFDKVFSVMESVGGLAANPSIAYGSNASFFVLSNKKEVSTQFLEGGNNHFPFMDKVSGSPMEAYFNIQAIMNGFVSEEPTDSINKTMFDISRSLWKDASYQGGTIQDDAATSTFEINLMDGNTNSLKQLNQYLGQIYLLTKEKEKQEAARWSSYTTPATIAMDSTAIMDSTMMAH